MTRELDERYDEACAVCTAGKLLKQRWNVSKKSMVVAKYSAHGQSVQRGEGEEGTEDKW